jgi:lipopolysaccharide/colanic/teichoic acid biosynthesis glycosyltransferase
MKRVFDIFFSLIGLLISLPLFAVVGILIKIDSTGPVFFRQERIGRNFERFAIFKFRTMVLDAEKKGLSITSNTDERVTRVGKILRKLKMDELPQLINVLRGDMSLVGPRPEVERYVELYKKDYREILKVRPGITDVSSILYRDEEGVLGDQADPESYYVRVVLPQKIKLSQEYLKKSSFSHDVKLILKTLFRVFLALPKN